MKEENSRIEYKEKLTKDKDFEKVVVSFLNSSEGGQIYIGVRKDNVPVGIENIDEVQRQIVDRIKDNIQPATLGLYAVTVVRIENKDVLLISIASGSEKPYYIRSHGMSTTGCFIRIGSSSQPMTPKMIEEHFSKRVRTSITKISSPKQNLSFAQLKIYYEENGLNLTEHFQHSLNLLTPEGEYNYLAYLLADENDVSVRIGKYRGDNKEDLIENMEFGDCCLIKSINRVLDRLTIENIPKTKITSKLREEVYPVDRVSLREATINSFVHNDYTTELSPIFEIFSDKLTITSAGGLFPGMTEEEFYKGFSKPRNRELMRIFRDLNLVENMGSGIPRILAKYDKSIFMFTANFLRVTFPYPEKIVKENEKLNSMFEGNRSVIVDKKKNTESGVAIESGDRVAIESGDRVAIENGELNLSNTEEMIYEYVKQHTQVSNSEAQKITNLKPSRVRYILIEMCKRGVLVGYGEGRYRHYKLNRTKQAI